MVFVNNSDNSFDSLIVVFLKQIKCWFVDVFILRLQARASGSNNCGALYSSSLAYFFIY